MVYFEFQCISSEEGQSVQHPKRKYGDKDQDNSPNDVNSYNTSSQIYRQI